MALTYTQAKASLDTIAQESEKARTDLELLQDNLAMIISRLDNLENNYTVLVTDIDTVAVNNPADTIWQNVKLEKDKLVTDFMAIRSTAANIQTAIDSVGT